MQYRSETMTFIWREPEDYADALDGEYDQDLSPDYFLFRRTEPWPRTDQVPIIRYPANAKRLQQFDILPNSTGIPLVKQQVLDVLKRFSPLDIEGVPVTVVANDQTISGFSLLNVLTEVRAIDMERSSYILITGTNHPRKFNRLILKRDALGDHHFGRDANYRSYLFVSDEVKVLVESVGWRGCRFIQPEDIK